MRQDERLLGDAQKWRVPQPLLYGAKKLERLGVFFGALLVFG